MKRYSKKLLVCSIILTMGLEQIGLPVYAEEPSANSAASEVTAEFDVVPETGEISEDMLVPDMNVPDTNVVPEDITEQEKPEVTEESKAIEKPEVLEEEIEKKHSEESEEDRVTELPANVNASGSCGINLSWELDETGMLTITGSGSMENYNSYSSRAPWYDSRVLIKKLVIGEGVTGIGNYAFSDCTGLEEVSFPIGLNTINYNAFTGCSALRSIILPDTVKTLSSGAFYNCSSLEEAVIPAYCTGTGVFDNSSAKLTIVAPKGSDGWQMAMDKNISYRDLGEGEGTVTCGNLFPETIHSGTLGDSTWTLSQTTGVLQVNGSGEIVNGLNGGGWISCREWINKAIVTGDFTSVQSYCFADCYRLISVQLPSTITTLGNGAFQYCVRLEVLDLPDGIKEIGYYAFSNCSSLKIVDIPASVTSIGMAAFKDCSALGNLILPAGITQLSESVFRGCKVLKLTVQGNLTEIGDYALYECAALDELRMADGLIRIGNYAFSLSGIQRVEMPDSVVVLGTKAFENCAVLESVKLSTGITEIPENCFYYCNALSEVNFPNGLTKIGTNAFMYCSALEEVVLPATLENIAQAFGYCSGLKLIEVDIGTEMKPLNAAEAFMRCGLDTLQVIIHGKNVQVPDRMFISSKMQNLVLDEGIIGIGREAFSSCRYLVSAKLPGVKEIGVEAFRFCSNLQSVEMKNVERIDKYAFEENHLISLTDAEVPNLMEIGVGAFRDSETLQKIQLSGVTNISDYAFYNCKALTYADVPEITVLSAYVFAGTGLTNFENSSITEADFAAFWNCKNLVSVSIPRLTAVPSEMFQNCSALTSFTISEDCSKIGYNAFYGCSELTALELPEGLRQIGDNAFSQTGLTEITIPASVENLGQKICSDVTSLRRVTLLAKSLNSPTSGSGAFQGTNNREPLEIIVRGNVIPYYCFSGLKIASLDLGNQVERIETNAFFGCSRLTSVTLPDSVTWLGDFAFSNNNGLIDVRLSGRLNYLGTSCFYRTAYLENIPVLDGIKIDQGWALAYSGSDAEIMIPEGCVGLAAEVFYNKKDITSVIFPTTIKYICDKAFMYCSSLENIELKGKLEYLGTDVFYGTKWQDSTEMQIIHSTNGDYFLGYKGKGEVLTLPESVRFVNLTRGSISNSVKKIVFTGEIETISVGSLGVTQANIEFAEPMSWLEVAEKYGSGAIRGSSVSQTASKSWGQSLGDLIGTSDQIVSLNGDSLDSLSSRRLVRKIMEEEGITNMADAYDWVCSHCGYTTSVGYPYSYADGPLLYGSASCQGYALAMKAFLDELGIKNYIAMGRVNGAYGIMVHAWNMVYIGDIEYVVDATDTRKGDYSTYMKSLDSLSQYTVDGYENGNADRRQAALDSFKGRTLSFSPLSFEENADGTVIVSSCEGGAENVVIPATWNGKAVTGIGENAFANCQWMTSVTIPNGIRSIGAYAFKNCIALKEITLPMSVKEMGAGAFLSCISLKKADLSNTKITSVPEYAFLGDLDLYEIYLPASVTSISSSCMSVKYINNTSGVFTCSIFGTAGSQTEAFATGKGLPFVDIGGGEIPEQETFEVEASQVVIRENFDFRLYVKASEGLLNDASSYMEFTVGNELQKVKAVSVGDGKVLYSCKVAAAQLADDIRAELYCNGECYDAGEYSVQAYLETLIRNENHDPEYATVHDLAINLLNYGAYAQKYFGYNTSHLANANLSADAVAAVTDDMVRNSISSSIYGTLSNQDLIYQGASLLCENAIGIRLYFANKNELSLSTIREKYSISVTGIESPDIETGMKGELFYITLRNIPIGGLEDEYRFRIGTIDVRYSPMMYVKQAMDSQDTAIKNLCKALWKLS